MPSPAPPLPVAILSGGLAMRLRPLTERVPKALIPVAGRPFLAHQINLLRSQGINRIILCVGHLGESIESAFGDGRQLGVQLIYSYDGAKLLGTGGALRKAIPLLGEAFYVLYGDSYLPTDYGSIARSFFASRRPALMTVYRNCDQWDASNIWFANGEIRAYDKKKRRTEMQHIDYGLSILSSEIFQNLPENISFDLAELLGSLVAQKKVAGHELHERFYEIGSPTGLHELERMLAQTEISTNDTCQKIP